MQWNTSYQESVFSFANNINTHEGGTHMQGFRSALTRTLNKYARDKGLLKEKEDNLEGEDVREGLAAVISVKLQNPQFEGQTKTKLGNPPIAGLVESTVNAEARGVLRGEPDRRAPDHQQGDRRLARPPGGAQGARADAAQVARSRACRCRASSPTARSTTPSRPSSSSSRATRAGGSAKQGRDRGYQAILPLRGKIINSEKNRINKVLSNNEIQAMITAIGTGIGDEFDLEKLRYHRVIVMTDADVDGSHIRTLILTFLYRQMPELIERGHVYIAVPPLYKVKLGNQEFYFEKDAQLEDLLARERIPQVAGHRPRRRRGEADRGEVEPLHEGDRAVRGLLRAAALRLRHPGGRADDPAPPGRARDRGRRRRARARSRAIAPNGYELSLARAGRRRLPRPARRDRDEHDPEDHGAGRAARLADLQPRCARRTRSSARSSGCRRSRSRSARRPCVAETFDELRARVLDAAKQGIQISRFKGLGEMNAEQLWETTMDPAQAAADPRRRRGRAARPTASSRC